MSEYSSTWRKFAKHYWKYILYADSDDTPYMYPWLPGSRLRNLRDKKYIFQEF